MSDISACCVEATKVARQALYMEIINARREAMGVDALQILLSKFPIDEQIKSLVDEIGRLQVKNKHLGERVMQLNHQLMAVNGRNE